MLILENENIKFWKTKTVTCYVVKNIKGRLRFSQRLRTHGVVHHSWWREEYLLQPNQPRMLNQGDSKKDTPAEQMDICGDARTCFAMSSYSIKRVWTTQRDPTDQI